MKKKILAIILAAAMLLTLAACASTAAPSENQGTSAETPASGETAEGKTYVVGICQLAQHVALDAATQDGTQLLVSRGLGASHRLPLRIGNPPELPVLILRAEGPEA